MKTRFLVLGLVLLGGVTAWLVWAPAAGTATPSSPAAGATAPVARAAGTPAESAVPRVAPKAGPAPAAPAPMAAGAIGPDARLMQTQDVLLSLNPAALRAALQHDRRAGLNFVHPIRGDVEIRLPILALTEPAEVATAPVVIGAIEAQPGSLVRLEFRGDAVTGFAQRPETHQALAFESDAAGRGRIQVYALHHALRCAVCDEAARNGPK